MNLLKKIKYNFALKLVDKITEHLTEIEYKGFEVNELIVTPDIKQKLDYFYDWYEPYFGRFPNFHIILFFGLPINLIANEKRTLILRTKSGLCWYFKIPFFLLW